MCGPAKEKNLQVMKAWLCNTGDLPASLLNSDAISICKVRRVSVSVFLLTNMHVSCSSTHAFLTHRAHMLYRT